MINRVLTITLILIPLAVFAQGEIDHALEYQRARELFQEGRYGLAQDRFAPLTQAQPGNVYVEYASFYYALSTYHQGYLYVARDMLRQIQTKYPQWEKGREVDLWLSLILFENRDLLPAMELSRSLEDTYLGTEVRQMQRFYLRKVHSLDSILPLFRQFPESFPLAEQTAYLISQQDFLMRDLDLLDSIIRTFGLKSEVPLDEMNSYGPKDRYEVALMFPFLASELEPNLNRKVNQFVIDLYQGIQMAADSLNQLQGGKIDLTLYDTRRDKAVIQELLQDNRLKRSDLIIGPLYNTELIFDFISRYRINAMHPYSEDADLLQGNPYFFLYSSVADDVARKAASLVVRDSTKRYGIVFYGDDPADSTMARIFSDSVTKAGFRIIHSQRIVSGEESKALQILTSGSVVNKLEEVEQTMLAKDSIDLVFVASSNRGGSVYSNILTGIEAREDTIPVLGTHNWLEDNVVRKDLFKKLKVTMAAYEVIDYASPGYYRFSDQYLARYGSVPSKFSAVGYDMMMFLGTQLKAYGRYFQRGLRTQGFVPGALSFGFDYSHTNSNSAIPVIEWNGSRIIIVDQLPPTFKSHREIDEEGQK